MNSRLLIAASLFLALIGCGGGGGSSTPPPPAPATPTGVIATPKDGYVLLDGNPIPNATGFNVYWSTTSGVTPATGNKIYGTVTPQAHTGLTNGTTYYYVVTALNGPSESGPSTEVSAKPVAVATGLTDPLLASQWHLSNTGQLGAKVGEDTRAITAWGTATTKGFGVRIAIVDDGLEASHEDLASNLAPNGESYNYVTGSSDPSNDSADTTSGHGTECAGIAASRDMNSLGGSGVAPRAELVGYNLILKSTTANEADAMTRSAAKVSISSNSWGAADGTGELSIRSSTWQSAIDTGLTTGRNGKGTIYLWAAGNGRTGSLTCPAPNCVDDSNYDGRANYRGVMAVGAVNDQGVQSSYSESGANLWVAAPGGEFCNTTQAITTTDRTGAFGHNPSPLTAGFDYPNQNYTKCMNGTSAATPGASGVVALMLAANPNLGWRDVRIIMAQAARNNDWGTCNVIPAPIPCLSTNTGWVLNGTAGAAVANPRYYFHHKYGFGVVDADLAVKIATGVVAGAGQTAGVPWVNVGPEVTYTSALASPAMAIPDAPAVAGTANPGVSSIIAVPATTGITSIEWVEVTFSATHPFTGDLDVALTSPSGMVSQLAVGHSCAGAQGACTSTYTGWIFGSAAHLGETPVVGANGNWTLTVKDVSPGGIGTFDSWKLKLYGH